MKSRQPMWFSASTVALVVATMAVPPLLAGILLLLSRRRTRT